MGRSLCDCVRCAVWLHQSANQAFSFRGSRPIFLHGPTSLDPVQHTVCPSTSLSVCQTTLPNSSPSSSSSSHPQRPSTSRHVPSTSSITMPILASAGPPLQNHQHTIRSLTGADVFPPSPCPSPVTPDKRYSRQNILIFRSAEGEERRLDSVAHHIDQPQLCPTKPRISSVTESSQASPRRSCEDLDEISLRRSLPDVDTTPLGPVYLDDDCDSTYSHASAINLDDLDQEELASLRLNAFGEPIDSPQVLNSRLLEIRRQSFAASFAKARHAKNRKALVLARPELQPHNRSVCLMERCVHGLTEVLDMNLLYAGIATDKFQAFSSLYTKEERQVITDLLKEASGRLRTEAPTPWRSPLRTARHVVIRSRSPQSQSANQLSNLFRVLGKRRTKTVSGDTLVRSVVFGAHVIPGVQSAESILLRMAGEYQREEVNRKASRAERIDIPLSFAMTLTAALAAFSRLECNVSYRRYRCRSASNRRGNPQALIMIKTKYDSIKLSFAITLHGESPCTVLFRRPRIFSLRKIDDYATLVTEAKDILSEFGQEVSGNRISYY